MRNLFLGLICLLFLLLGVALAQWLPQVVDSRLPTLLAAKSQPPASNKAAETPVASNYMHAPPAVPQAGIQPPAPVKAQPAAAETATTAPAEPGKASETKLRYRLIGIITTSGTPPERSALIAWVHKEQPDGRYTAGSALPDGGKLTEVTDRRVSIEYKGNKYVLKLRDQPPLTNPGVEASLPQASHVGQASPPPTPATPPAIFGFNPADHADPQAAFEAWYAEVQKRASDWQQQQTPAKGTP